MAERRVYTDEDKATVFAHLTANTGNVKRTSRELAIPEQTVRDWKKEWAREGVPANVQDAFPAAQEAFVTRALEIRDKALDTLEEKIEAGDAKVGELNAVIGTLTDKINLLTGHATNRSETVNVGPTPEEFAAQLSEYMARTVRDAELREADIVDAEFEEQAPVALPAAS